MHFVLKKSILNFFGERTLKFAVVLEDACGYYGYCN